MTDDVIWIESTRGRHDMGSACLIRWGAIEKYAPIVDVRQTAEDLFTCAAYADLIAELLRVGFEPELITSMMTALLGTRHHFGTPTTLFMIPAGSTAHRVGVVSVALKNRFHQGEADKHLSPSEARTMGRAWLEAAEASEADDLFSSVLAGWLDSVELDAVFSLLKDVRSGEATLP